MIGNEGVLTYINQTSQGQSGGAVIQNNLLYGGYYNEHKLVGIHVSGYFQQSKCTLLLKSNIDWIKSFWGIKKKDSYQNLPWQERILNFLVKLENVNDELIISDLECFPVTSKLIGLNSQNTTLSKVKINLKLDELNNDAEKIHDRIQCLSNIIFKGSNITSLNLNSTKFDMENNGFVDLCSGLHGSSLKNLNLFNCGITSLEPICEVLLDTQLEELNLSWNNFGDNGLVDLCSVLPGSSLKTLNLYKCRITSLEPICKVLLDTKLEEINLGDNKFGNHGFVDLCFVLPGSSLKTLNLMGCRITSLEPICEVLLDTQLEELDLSWNQIKGDKFTLPGCSIRY